MARLLFHVFICLVFRDNLWMAHGLQSDDACPDPDARTQDVNSLLQAYTRHQQPVASLHLSNKNTDDDEAISSAETLLSSPEEGISSPEEGISSPKEPISSPEAPVDATTTTTIATTTTTTTKATTITTIITTTTTPTETTTTTTSGNPFIIGIRFNAKTMYYNSWQVDKCKLFVNDNIDVSGYSPVDPARYGCKKLSSGQRASWIDPANISRGYFGEVTKDGEEGFYIGVDECTSPLPDNIDTIVLQQGLDHGSFADAIDVQIKMNGQGWKHLTSFTNLTYGYYTLALDVDSKEDDAHEDTKENATGEVTGLAVIAHPFNTVKDWYSGGWEIVRLYFMGSKDMGYKEVGPTDYNCTIFSSGHIDYTWEDKSHDAEKAFEGNLNNKKSWDGFWNAREGTNYYFYIGFQHCTVKLPEVARVIIKQPSAYAMEFEVKSQSDGKWHTKKTFKNKGQGTVNEAIN